MVNESYLPEGLYTFAGSYLKENNEIVVPPGKYFVSGDNRPHSLDSREFGTIAKEDIIGKAMLRYWPFDRAGIIKNPFGYLAHSVNLVSRNLNAVLA